jgi:ABC-2 type transport system permease protein
MTTAVVARPAGFWKDLLSIAGRALRGVLREPEQWVPGLIVPVFFFTVNVGSLERVSGFAGVSDFRAFQLPVAIIFAVTGISRASALVTDIENGYFDRLLVSPVNRLSLLIGLMIADVAFAMALSVPVVILGLVTGVRWATGLFGILTFIGLAGAWALVFAAFPYTIALRTASAAAVNSSFILFFPFAFLTTTFLPIEALSGWLATAARYNPITYLLDGLRSTITSGWVAADLLKALGAIASVGVVSMTLAFLALGSRVRRP